MVVILIFSFFMSGKIDDEPKSDESLPEQVQRVSGRTRKGSERLGLVC